MIGQWYPFLIPLGGVVIIGFLAGLVGTFAFLRKQTMLGDVVAHAALPGIVAAFIVTESSSLAVLMTGGLIAGLLAILVITFLSRYTIIQTDALFGIVLSVSFGVGLMLLTYVQKLPLASQSVLNKFLFGSAATLLRSDLWILMLLAVVVVTTVFYFWTPFTLITFDAEYARSRGMPVTGILMLLQIVTVLVIVIGLYAVGVVLMSSLLVAPAVTARHYTRSVVGMAVCAGLYGAFSCGVGMLISMTNQHLPSGACMVVVATVGAVMTLGWRRGVAKGA